ncbi:MAG: ribosomal L7Ae/L30e/S12e/Gadd45 family protein [Clostridiales bacterium]|nr:ribosomal L7Ae/L30e/S12e/Gadd45 family protein [Clostridiales bacterium]
MNDRFLSMMGLCRKAGKLIIGHDACITSIISGRAKICMLCTDASERLKNEFKKAACYGDRNLPLAYIEYSMDDVRNILGFRAGVFTVEDEGFSKKFFELVRTDKQ